MLSDRLKLLLAVRFPLLLVVASLSLETRLSVRVLSERLKLLLAVLLPLLLVVVSLSDDALTLASVFAV